MWRILMALLAVGVLGPAAAPAREYAKFDVVGDSVSAGINFSIWPPVGGWTQMLLGQQREVIGSFPTIYQLWPGIDARNSALIGSEASDWARPDYQRMNDLIAREPDLVVVFIGGNDFLGVIGDGELSFAEKEAFRNNLRTIIDRLQGMPSDPDIIVVQYYDLFDGQSELVPAQLSRYRIGTQAVIEGNQIIADVAAEKGCFLVDGIADTFFGHCYGQAIGGDPGLLPKYILLPLEVFDIHPVTPGYAAMYWQIYAKLLELKALDRPAAADGWVLYR